MTERPDLNDRLVLVSHILCPYVQRAVIALREKGVDYQRVDIDLASKPGWFLTLNPLGKTPVLLVPQPGGEPVAIFESAVICDYLDETELPRLHPERALDRARHRAWVEVASTTLQGIWQYYTAKDEADFLQRQAELTRRFEQIESALGDGPWFAGNSFSLVDAAFAPVFRYFEVIDRFHPSNVLASSPRTKRWAEALRQRPSVIAAVHADYAIQLREFFERQHGWLGTLSQAHRAATA